MDPDWVGTDSDGSESDEEDVEDGSRTGQKETMQSYQEESEKESDTFEGIDQGNEMEEDESEDDDSESEAEGDDDEECDLDLSDDAVETGSKVKKGNPHFNCSLCKKKLRSKQGMQGHLRVCHEDLCRDMLDVKPTDNVKCQICEDDKISAVNYGLHVDAHINNQIKKNRKWKHRCSECKELFANDKRITRHAPLHMKPEDFQKVKNPYKCKTCGVMRRTIGGLTTHQLHCTGISLVCKVCSYEARDVNNLIHHMDSHREDAYFSCPVCSSDLQSYDSFSAHMRQFHPQEWAKRQDTRGLEGTTLKRKVTDLEIQDKKKFQKRQRTVEAVRNFSEDPIFNEEFPAISNCHGNIKLQCALCGDMAEGNKLGKLQPFNHVINCHKKLCYGQLVDITSTTLVQCSFCKNDVLAIEYACHIHLEYGKIIQNAIYPCPRPDCTVKVANTGYIREHDYTHWTRENFESFGTIRDEDLEQDQDKNGSTSLKTDDEAATTRSSQNAEPAKVQLAREQGKVCRYCGQVFVRDRLQLHQDNAEREIETNGLNLDETPYACTEEGCTLQFPTQVCLVYHLTVGHDKKRHAKTICPICKHILPTKPRPAAFNHVVECHKSLLNDDFTRKPSDPYTCDKCQKVMTCGEAAAHYQMELNKTYSNARINFDYECPETVCLAKLKDEREVELHRRMHLDQVVVEEYEEEPKQTHPKIKKYQCPFSNHIIFGISASNYNMHIKNCNDEIAKHDLNQSETPYKCPVDTCQESFTTRACLCGHHNTAHGKKFTIKSICPLCKRRVDFRNREETLRHLVECHGKLMEGKLPKKPTDIYTCWDCKKENITYKDAAAHTHKDMEEKMKATTYERQCQKKGCRAKCVNDGELELHKKMHAKTFNEFQKMGSDFNLKRHCPHCKKTFRDNLEYKSHMKRIAVEETECSCSLKDEFEKLKHKMYKCRFKHCQQVFKYRACQAAHAWKEHVRGFVLTLHDHKLMHDYRCPRNRRCIKCSRPFLTRKMALHHMKSCKSRRFKCHICERLFKNTTERGTHERRVHKPSTQPYKLAFVDFTKKPYYPRAEEFARKYKAHKTKIPKEPYRKAEYNYSFRCTHCCRFQENVWGEVIRHMESFHKRIVPVIVKGRLTAPRYYSSVPIIQLDGKRPGNACYICHKRYFCKAFTRIHQQCCQRRHGVVKCNGTPAPVPKEAFDVGVASVDPMEPVVVVPPGPDNRRKDEEPKVEQEAPPVMKMTAAPDLIQRDKQVTDLFKTIKKHVPVRKRTALAPVQPDKEVTDFFGTINEHVPKDQYPCGSCPHIFESREQVLDHVKKEHSLNCEILLDGPEGVVATEPLEDGSTPDYICYVCCNRYYSKSFSKMHVRSCIFRRERALKRKREQEAKTDKLIQEELSKVENMKEETGNEDLDELTVVEFVECFKPVEVGTSNPFSSMEEMEELQHLDNVEEFDYDDVKVALQEDGAN